MLHPVITIAGASACVVPLFWRALVHHNSYNGRFPAIFIPRLFFVVYAFAVPLGLLASLSFVLFLLWLLSIVTLLAALRVCVALQRRRVSHPRATVLGLYHPHCDQRAGGEKVLWSLVETLLAQTAYDIVIYSNALTADQVSAGAKWMQERGITVDSSAAKLGDKDSGALALDVTTTTGAFAGTGCAGGATLRRLPVWQGHGQFILHQAASIFALPALTTPSALSRVRFVFLSHTDMTDAAHHPRLTLLTQSLAALLPAIEAALATVLLPDDGTALCSLGSMRLNLSFRAPDAVMDTAGYPFAVPVFAAAVGLAGAYVHYPIITHSMIARVESGQIEIANSLTLSDRTATNSAVVKRSKLGEVKARVKMVYYRVFAELYRLAGLAATVLTVNSHWTQRELDKVWRRSGVSPHWQPSTGRGTHGKHDEMTVSKALELRERTVPCVFPPCKTGPLSPALATAFANSNSSGKRKSVAIPDGELVTDADSQRKPVFVSLGQFRPEKNHMLQLDAFERALKTLSSDSLPQSTSDSNRNADSASVSATGSHSAPLELVMIGTTRAEDMGRIAALQQAIKDRGLSHCARMLFDVPRAELDAVLATALGGLHCMRDEHFGIGVVELLDAGIVTIAHRSAGPAMDIVVPAIVAIPDSSTVDADDNAKNKNAMKMKMVVAADPSASLQSIAASASTQHGDREQPVDGDDVQPVGYLAETEAEYAAAMVDVMRRYRAETAAANSASASASGSVSGRDNASDRDRANTNGLRQLRQAARLRARAMFGEDSFAVNVMKHIVAPVDKAVGRASAPGAGKKSD